MSFLSDIKRRKGYNIRLLTYLGSIKGYNLRLV